MEHLKKTKIFISAFACDPTIGSEPGVGWHWTLELSKYYEIWVLTAAYDHGLVKNKIEKYFSEHPNEDKNIHFIYYDIKPLLFMKKNLMTMRLYYIVWQYAVNKIIDTTMKKNNIEIFHLLTYGNMIWPISSKGQNYRFIWGPTGGMDIVEREFSKHYSIKSRFFEALRRRVVSSVQKSLFFKKKCKKADLILCKAQTAMNAIPDQYKEKAVIFTDVAMNAFDLQDHTLKVDKELVFLSVGRMDAWRGFDILIDAFIEYHKLSNSKLILLGDGTEYKFLVEKINRNNASAYIQMPGNVSMEEYNQYMKNCDIVVNSCLKEGAVTNAFDCMRWGKPLICIDTGGYTRNFSSKSAYIIPRFNNRKEIQDGLLDAMKAMSEYETRKQYSEEVIKLGEKFEWEKKGEEIRALFDKKIDEWKVK